MIDNDIEFTKAINNCNTTLDAISYASEKYLDINPEHLGYIIEEVRNNKLMFSDAYCKIIKFIGTWEFYNSHTKIDIIKGNIKNWWKYNMLCINADIIVKEKKTFCTLYPTVNCKSFQSYHKLNGLELVTDECSNYILSTTENLNILEEIIKEKYSTSYIININLLKFDINSMKYRIKIVGSVPKINYSKESRYIIDKIELVIENLGYEI